MSKMKFVATLKLMYAIIDHTKSCPSVPDHIAVVMNLPRSALGLVKVSRDCDILFILTFMGDAADNTTPSALYDPHAWEILRRFLTSDMSMGEMDAALESHLGTRFSADDWDEPRRLLFSGDGDDALSLANLIKLKVKYVPEPELPRAIPVQRLRKPRKVSQPSLII